MKKHEMKHLSPPAVAKNGNYQGMVFTVLFEEFNCNTEGKTTQGHSLTL